MRNINFLLLLGSLVCLFLAPNLSAQDTLMVSPGEGTLNDAIDAYGSSKIYKLEAGQWYGLTKPIENVDYHLQIIGEKVDIYNGQTLPATLQTGTTAEGTALGLMFDAKGDISLENIYVMNVDLNGQIGNDFLNQADSAGRVVIDHCVIDPMCTAVGVRLSGGVNDMFFTNNIVLRRGNETALNDGHTFILHGAAGGVDTAWIENNTFVDQGTFFINGGWHTKEHNFILFNHNTVIRHKGEWEAMMYEKEFYHTNNLLYDISTVPVADNVTLPGKHAEFPLRELIMADSLSGEGSPIDRVEYFLYNSMFKNEEWYTDLERWNDTMDVYGLTPVFFQPLMWDGNVPEGYWAGNGQVDPPFSNDWAQSRAYEHRVFNTETNTNPEFPNFKYGHMTYDVDPLFNDSRIYQKSMEYVEWAYTVYLRDQLQYPNPERLKPANELPSWMWDPDGDITINDTWPVFDGSYGDESTLEGSIASFPLGDLNWFPEKKATWENHKDTIFNHMKAGITERLDLNSTAVKPSTTFDPIDAKVYPNPVQNTATVEFNLKTTSDVKVTLYNCIGIKVLDIVDGKRTAGNNRVSFNRGDLPNGVYLINIQSEGQSGAYKISFTD